MRLELHPPHDSWWTHPDFYRRAKWELARMRNSKFGLMLSPGYGWTHPLGASYFMDKHSTQDPRQE
jgi:hypothetical protein